jgi:YHS domain-containing protein
MGFPQRRGRVFHEDRAASATIRTWPVPEAEDKETSEVTATVRDPVCGMEIQPKDAVATEDHDGRTFYFCSHACHETFVNDPHRYGHPED